MSFKAEINVLKNFNGIQNADVIEIVTRTVQSSGYRDRKGRPQQRRQWVSYKGEDYSLFTLTEASYGVGGYCISIDG